MRHHFFVCAGLCLVALSLLGQSLTSVSGTVTDPTGALLPGAVIRMENLDTGVSRETASDSGGLYSFPQIQPGSYKITARAQGFADVTIGDVRLLVNSPATIHIQFAKVGAVAETVAVSAETIQVNTSDATLGNVMSGQSIGQLPFEARSIVGLLALQPGVLYIGETNDFRNGAVNGGKSDQANVTLDGVDVNDQQNRFAFNSVLRMTLDSVQEFRVTTLNSNADQGRSSGAQIALVTKSGTNNLHGSFYEYLRNTKTSANDFFNNLSGVDRPTLNRNTFGASIGGPFRQNRFFYFFNYEGRRDKSEASTSRLVPSDKLRQGILQYQAADGSIKELSPQEVRARVDPAGIGPNPAVLQVFQSYPAPNDFTLGDGANIVGYRFKAPLRGRQNTYIAKLDYVLDADNRHQLFWRGNLQNDNFGGLPQFPGEPPNNVSLNNSKGYAIGWNALLRPNLVSVTRYGYTRQGVETTGIQSASAVSFRGISDRFGLTRGLSQILPVHHITQDFTWTRGPHSVQWGGTLRWIRSNRNNFGNAFHSASTNSSWLRGIGADLHANVPDLAARFRTAYRDASMALLGIISQGNALYNYDVQGTVQPTGAPVKRVFAGEEYEMYVQDNWRVSRALTITAGLRWSLMPPIYEASGVQVSTDQSIGEWFNKRGGLAEAGRSQLEAGRITYILHNQGGRPLYPYHKKNLAPRLALTYSPQSNDGLGKFLFGGPGRTAIRAGWGMFYDLFGLPLIGLYDSTAFGLSTRILNPPNVITATAAPRFTGIFNLPGQLIQPAPKGGFPQLYPDLLSITNSLDDTLRPPYSLSMNFSIGREFAHGIYIQGAYVGRLSRRSLIQRDLSMITNLKDPASGMTYFEGAQQLVGHILGNTPQAQVPRIAFWENMWPGAAGGGRTATQNIYTVYRNNLNDWTSALYDLDAFCDPACSRLGRYAMFAPQYSALAGWSSIAGGNYHGMQWTVRKRFTAGHQFDFNYTWSKSIDLASGAERAGSFGGGFLLNPWFPGQRKGVSDFDATQQWVANYVVELPVGRGKKFLSNASGPLNHILGGWQVSGIWRQTTELPVGVGNGRFWPTNWNISGFATQTGIVPTPRKSKNAPAVAGRPGPNLFADPKPALDAYSYTLPGETGQRNGIRGDGFFTVDLGVGKRFTLPMEGHSLQFRWETFNLSNTVRFDVNSLTLDLGNTGSFGKYSGVLTSPRVMQFGLRYEF